MSVALWSSEVWHRAIGAGGPDEVDEDWIRAPIESMVSLLDPSHLGRA